MSSIQTVARRLGLACAIAALPAAAVHAAASAPTHHGAPAAAAHRAPTVACDAVGTYQVGPALTPLMGSSGRGAGSAPPTGIHSGPMIAWPYTALHGTLTISSYSGCGVPTAGTFSVHRSYAGPWPQQPGRGTAVPCAETCGWPVTGIITATGSFRQDPLHASDPAYVLVDANITWARLGRAMGIPCSTRSGCPPAGVTTSVVAFTDVTGYLEVSGTTASTTAGSVPQPASSGQTAMLSFLAPPAASGDDTPTIVTLQGWRGRR